ncbi:MAG: hypothetical protein QW597_05325 [Thermoplasmataceae archaeon]
MNKYVTGALIGIAIGVVGLGLLIYQTLITPPIPNYGLNVSEIPPAGILYALIFAVGVIVAIAMASLNSPTRPNKK